MKSQSKAIGIAIGVVLIISVFLFGITLSNRGKAISNGYMDSSEGGVALSIANTENTEIIVNDLAFETPKIGFFLLGLIIIVSIQRKNYLITMGLDLIFQVSFLI